MAVFLYFQSESAQLRSKCSIKKHVAYSLISHVKAGTLTKTALASLQNNLHCFINVTTSVKWIWFVRWKVPYKYDSLLSLKYYVLLLGDKSVTDASTIRVFSFTNTLHLSIWIRAACILLSWKLFYKCM